jgi:putative copper export protein
VRLTVLWLHLVGMAVWVGGLAYQTHVLLPAARRGQVASFTEAALRARPITWAAVALVVLTGLYNVTQLGPLERVMTTGAGLLLAGKFFLVLLAVALAGQRDFAQLPQLAREPGGAGSPERVLRVVAWLDRAVLVLVLVIVYLGLAVARA